MSARLRPLAQPAAQALRVDRQGRRRLDEVEESRGEALRRVAVREVARAREGLETTFLDPLVRLAGVTHWDQRVARAQTSSVGRSAVK